MISSARHRYGRAVFLSEITSFDQIAKLRAEAASAGDDAQVELCDIVLHSAGRRPIRNPWPTEWDDPRYAIDNDPSLTQDQRRKAAKALEACRLAIQDAEAQS